MSKFHTFTTQATQDFYTINVCEDITISHRCLNAFKL